MIDPVHVEALRAFSTPSILNGLKRLGLQPSEMQTMSRHAIRCISPALGPRAGFAVTRTVATSRTADSRGVGSTTTDEQSALLAVPEPRFLVVQNIGDWQGPVCIWGELAASINLALGVCAGITNGPVRDIPEMEASGFLAFAGGVDVGGGFVERIACGQPVDIGGVRVEEGDVLHGDLHGVVKVPPEFVSDLPGAIAAHEETERDIIDLCRSASFTPDALNERWARQPGPPARDPR